MPPAEPRRGPLPALTGARFLAASSVVLYHYGQEALGALSPALQRLAAAGPAAVSFFYVLSGAVMTWGCSGADGRPSRDRRTFWRQRAARILPAYLLALLLALPPFAAHDWLLFHRGAPGRIALGAVSCALLLQAWLPQLAAGLNTPGWSISCEAFFYAAWPSLSARLRQARRGFPFARVAVLWLLAMVPALLALAWLKQGEPAQRTFATIAEDAPLSELLCRFLSYFPLLRLPEFLIGIALGHALRAAPDEPAELQRGARFLRDSAAELSLLAVSLGAAWALGSGLPSRLAGAPLADRIFVEGPALSLLFAGWVWRLARGRGLLAALLARPALLALGEASYALYILQDPLLVWSTGLARRLAPALLAHWPLVFWGWFAGLIAASLAAHRWLEQPLRAAWLRRSAPRR